MLPSNRANLVVGSQPVICPAQKQQLETLLSGVTVIRHLPTDKQFAPKPAYSAVRQINKLPTPETVLDVLDSLRTPLGGANHSNVVAAP